MPKVINCPCGYVVRANSDTELIKLAQQHAKEAHGMALARDEALAMARLE